ncbi:SAM-dependent methyltransferase [Aeromicrobium wangtongii]|uniref:SAM-dependent methyltransferase n=1 Tax=Aeromicrobium wangtongii TaxID=2969247 RepID=UPI002016B081|nr:class I SAM-dependent methyltransferase [Aeromicrobium wangtongii]MCL3817210.1 class I SAM-dependent methyltransferase [Aeromicrobium wangtongii]
MDRTTPLRDLTTTPDGLVVLRDHESTYADGAEAHVLEIARAASDVSSTSDELISQATDWPTRYHLDPARANIVRALDLRPDARVLEVGAGCGAVTRYLAERVELVDALEPVPSRARVIVERTRDLGNTRVFVGHVEDVPDEPAYDVVVVIGVLEYVANGSDDRQPYLDFLAGIRSRLVPGGTLVLAIENKLGVKYLAGSPEDHSNRVADSMESYPYGSPARTFSRAELLALMSDAGLTGEDRIALPDYKMTEAVVDPARIPAGRERLLSQVSAFPSPDWVPSVGRFADERKFWESLIDAGLAAETGNSFLILATNGTGGPEMWDPSLVGAYWPVGLLAEHTHTTRLTLADDGLELAPLVPEHENPVRSAPVVANTAPQQDIGAPNFLDRARRVDQDQLERMVGDWSRTLTERAAGGGPVEWDCVPHRMVVAEDGTLRPCRVEWHLDAQDWDTVRRRGVVLLADRLARTTRADRWPGVANVRELATQLGVAAGLPDDGSWLDLFVDEEAVALTAMRHRPAHTTVEDVVDATRDDLRAMLHRPTGPIPLLGDRLVATQGALSATREALAVSQADRARLTKRVSSLKRKVAAAAKAVPAEHSLRNHAPQWVKRAGAPVLRTIRTVRDR